MCRKTRSWRRPNRKAYLYDVLAEKRISIKLLGDAKDAYLTLKKKVAEDTAKGITDSFHQTLLKQSSRLFF